MEKTKIDIKKYFDFAVSLRRYLHENPELSFKEYNTTKYIKQKLLEINKNIEFLPCLKTGLIGYLDTPKKNKKTVLLRADIDALPIKEETELKFKSKNEGVMHACGHDFHSANLLACLKLLYDNCSYLKYNIAFVFQPGEEKLPGGASLILKTGVVDKINPNFVIGLHIDPSLSYNTIGVRAGEYMAANDEIYIEVFSEGGHAALPHLTNDTVLTASAIIVNLQQVVSRIVPANVPAVLSFGKIIGNGATNIIPNKVNIEGTFRIFNEKWREISRKKIIDIIKTTANSYGCDVNIKLVKGYPVLKNNTEITEKFINSVNSLENISLKMLEIRPTSEDFAYFSQKYKSLFFRVGVKNKKKNYGLHNSKLNLNEAAFYTSIRAVTNFLLK